MSRPWTVYILDMLYITVIAQLRFQINKAAFTSLSYTATYYKHTKALNLNGGLLRANATYRRRSRTMTTASKAWSPKGLPQYRIPPYLPPWHAAPTAGCNHSPVLYLFVTFKPVQLAHHDSLIL